MTSNFRKFTIQKQLLGGLTRKRLLVEFIYMPLPTVSKRLSISEIMLPSAIGIPLSQFHGGVVT